MSSLNIMDREVEVVSGLVSKVIDESPTNDFLFNNCQLANTEYGNQVRMKKVPRGHIAERMRRLDEMIHVLVEVVRNISIAVEEENKPSDRDIKEQLLSN